MIILKNKIKLYSAILAGLMAFSTVTPTIASAAEFSNAENVVEEVHTINEDTTVEEEQTAEELQSLDQFVSVENNQFVLNLPDYVEIDDATYNALVSSIDTANTEVVNNNATIDPNTKTINTNEMTLFATKGYSSKKFWWGERATYSNTQTIKAVKEINVGAAKIALGAGGMAFIPVLNTAAATAGVTAGYLILLSSKMDAANKGRGVIVDVTWALIFTVKSR